MGGLDEDRASKWVMPSQLCKSFVKIASAVQSIVDKKGPVDPSSFYDRMFHRWPTPRERAEVSDGLWGTINAAAATDLALTAFICVRSSGCRLEP